MKPKRGIAAAVAANAAIHTTTRAPLHAAVLAVALLLTFVAFGNGISGEFVSDDTNCIVENEHVTGPLDVRAIFSRFSWWGAGRVDSPGYRPLITLSFALNHSAVGLSPFGYHVTNFVFHAVVVWLLFVLARSLGVRAAGAAAAAAIFCVLPIHSEAVLWVVGRAELGAAIGFLLTVWLVVLYRRSGRLWLLAAAAAALLCGALCKENAVTALAAPLVLGLVMPNDRLGMPTDLSDASSSPWTRYRHELLAMAALAAAVALYIAIRAAADGSLSIAKTESPLDNPLAGLGTGQRWLGAVSVLGRYLWLTLVGYPLSSDYSYDALAIHEGFAGDRYAALAVVAVAAVAAAAWSTRRSAPAIAVGVALGAAAYSIVSNIVVVIGTIAGERLFYLPSAGLCLAVGAALDPLLATAAARRRAGVAALALACAAWVTIDRQRASQWHDAISLFEAAVSAVPRSARAHMELASAYGRAGRIDEAASHFESSLAIKPDYASAAYNFGNTLARAGRFDDAAVQYRRAIQSDANLTRAWHNLALVYRIQSRPDLWLEALAGAIGSAPQSADLQLEYAEALLNLGRNQEAADAYSQAIRLGTDTTVAYFNRAVARHRLGGCLAALEDYRAAASRPSAPAAVMQALKGCLLELGRSDEAAQVDAGGKVANQGTRR